MARLSNRLGRTWAPAPALLNVCLTYRCNCRCVMCGQWGPNGWLRHDSRGLDGALLSGPQWLSFFTREAPRQPGVGLWGGEPLLHPDIDEILAGLDRLKLQTSIITNATLLDRHMDRVLSMSRLGVFVSLDGPADVHDAVRNHPGAFAKVTANIRTLLECRRQTGQAWPGLHVYGVVNWLNHDRLGELFETVRGLGVPGMTIGYISFLSPRMETANCAAYRSAFGYEPVAPAGFVLDVEKINVENIIAATENLRQRYGDGRFVFQPRLTSQQVRDYYHNPAELFGRSTCHMPWRRADLMPNGDLAFCADFPDYIVGNITQTPLGASGTAPRPAASAKSSAPACCPNATAAAACGEDGLGMASPQLLCMLTPLYGHLHSVRSHLRVFAAAVVCNPCSARISSIMPTSPTYSCIISA